MVCVPGSCQPKAGCARVSPKGAASCLPWFEVEAPAPAELPAVVRPCPECRTRHSGA